MDCMRPRLLALDIDGTITNSQHDVSSRTVAAIGKARAAGMEVVLATGRRYRDALAIAQRVGVTHPLVTTAGALIKEPQLHVTQYRAAFLPGVLEGVLQLIDAAGHEAVVYTDSFAEGFDFHCRGLECGGDGLRSYLARNRSLARVTPSLHQQPPRESFAAFCMGSQREMLTLETALREAFPAETSVHVIRSPKYRGYLCEIAPAGVTKWSGICQLAHSLGVASEEVCAVGDDLNDLPMICAAGLGVAMGNADPRVQAAADRVTGSNDADGLAALIDQLLAEA
jgi:Cof subfamily protein (haloacid dehalogenase superfamily)